MIKILNFGSINVDHVYAVEHFVRPGETIRCEAYRRCYGGKGLNQSIALAQAGALVYHAGRVGTADTWLKTLMEDKGVDTQFIEVVDSPSGHAIIQVNAEGENSIIIIGGANQLINESDIDRVLASFGSGDFLVVQNEVNAVPQIIRSAKSKGMKIVFNPAPMSAQVADYPLELVDILIMNETEANSLTGETDQMKIFNSLNQRFPGMALVLTMGHKGSAYFSSQAYTLLLTAIKGQYAWWLFFLPLAVLNKETDILILLLYSSIIISTCKNWSSRLFVALGFMFSIAIYLYIRQKFSLNHGQIWLQLDTKIPYLTTPKNYFLWWDFYAPMIPFPSGFNIIWLLVLTRLLFWQWSKKPILVKTLFYVALSIIIPLFILFCKTDEIRNLSFLFVPIYLLSIRTLLTPDFSEKDNRWASS